MVKSELVQKLCNTHPNILRKDIEKIFDVIFSEIVEALDGPIARTACVDGAEDHCSVEALCPMRGNWNRVNKAIRGALEDVSLADLIDPAEMFPIPERKTLTGIEKHRSRFRSEYK